MIHEFKLMKRIGKFLHGTLVRMLWNHAPTCAFRKLLCSLSQKRTTLGHGFRQAFEVLRPPLGMKLQKAKASARQSLSGGTHDARRGTDAPGCVAASLPTAGLTTGCSSHSIPAVSIHARSLDDSRIPLARTWKRWDPAGALLVGLGFRLAWMWHQSSSAIFCAT